MWQVCEEMEVERRGTGRYDVVGLLTVCVHGSSSDPGRQLQTCNKGTRHKQECVGYNVYVRSAPATQ